MQPLRLEISQDVAQAVALQEGQAARPGRAVVPCRPAGKTAAVREPAREWRLQRCFKPLERRQSSTDNPPVMLSAVIK